MLNNTNSARTNCFLALYLMLSFIISGLANKKCSNDHMCPDYSKCDLRTKFCVCHDNFVMIDENGSSSCLEVVKDLKGFCQFDKQCEAQFSTDAYCLNGSCECRESAHFNYDKKKCYRTKFLGELCRFNEECYDQKSRCQSGVCECAVKMHPDSTRGRCLDDADLGESCRTSDECITENAKCRGVCECREDYFLDEHNRVCLKVAAKLGDGCFNDKQCTRNIAYSFCNINPYGNATGKCSCRQGYHELNHECWVSVELDQDCDQDENCALIANALCIAEKCVCPEDLRNIDGVCSRSSTVLTSFTLLFLTIGLYFIKNTCS